MRTCRPAFRPARIVVLLAAACCVAGPAGASWSPRIHAGVAEQAARLMPASLRHLLASNRARLLEGAVAPARHAGDASRVLHAGDSFGTLDLTVLEQSQRVMDLLGRRAPSSTIAYELGVLSHHVALAQNPLHVAIDDPRASEWAGQFLWYVDDRLPRYRVVFTGLHSPALARDDIRAFVREACNRTRLHYPVLASSFVGDDGRILRAAAFDDRHPVFGVASLSYARSIGETARLWAYLWARSNGDTSGLPFPHASTAVSLGAEPGQ